MAIERGKFVPNLFCEEQRQSGGNGNSSFCPCCKSVYDGGEKRKLTEECGHQVCHSCILQQENCPLCNSNETEIDFTGNLYLCVEDNASVYDTGISSNSVLSSTHTRSFLKPGDNLFYHLMRKSDVKTQSDEMIKPRGNGKSKDVFFRSVLPKILQSPFRSETKTPPLPFMTETTKSYLSEQCKNDSKNQDRKKNWRQLRKSMDVSVNESHSGPLPTVFRKIKSLWVAQTVSSNSGLNVLAENEASESHSQDLPSTLFSWDTDIPLKYPLKLGCKDESNRLNQLKGDLPSLSVSLVESNTSYSSLSSNENFKQDFETENSMIEPLYATIISEKSCVLIERQWIFYEISSNISKQENSGIFITGIPGSGKTTLLRHLVRLSLFKNHSSGGNQKNVNCHADKIAFQIAAFHFCQADNNVSCQVPKFLVSIVKQFCQVPALRAYNELLQHDANIWRYLTIEECTIDPFKAFVRGVLEPLEKLRRNRKIKEENIVVLIDALCEAEYHRPDYGYTMASFLSKILDCLPPWVKIVASARPNMLNQYKWQGLKKFSLDETDCGENYQKDIFDYIKHRTVNSVRIQENIKFIKENKIMELYFTEHLLLLAKGSFLHTKLTLDLIEQGNLILKSSSCNMLPVSLPQIYLLSLNLRFPSIQSFDRVRRILSVCLASLRPLSQFDIYLNVSMLSNQVKLPWNEFSVSFNSLSGFLTKSSDDTFRFFHPSFREWLLQNSEGQSSKFSIDLKEGHAAIAFRLSIPENSVNFDHALELGHHILKAGLHKSPSTFKNSLDYNSIWINEALSSISEALCSLKNIYSTNIQVSKLLLMAGANPNFKTSCCSNSPILCLAAYEGNIQMVKLLLDFGATVSSTNDQGSTALMLAALRGHLKIMELLISSGSFIGQIDKEKSSVFAYASIGGFHQIIKFLCSITWTPRTGTDDLSVKKAKVQALIAASANPSTTEIFLQEILHTEDVAINEIDPISGETALTMAVVNGNFENVVFLLRHGACPDTKNERNISPLALASKAGNARIAKELLDNFADIEQICENSGKTPLMIAAEEGNIEVIEMLLEKGAFIDSTDKSGMTALSWSCMSGKVVAAKKLIENGSNVHHIDIKNRTLLDFAVMNCSEELIDILVNNGISLIGGQHYIETAILNHNILVLETLLRRGMEIRPSSWRLANGKSDIITILLNQIIEDGNTLYRLNDFQRASNCYQFALSKIQYPDETEPALSQLKFNLLLNLSRCKRKLREILKAICLATDAIKIDPSHYGGYYARAKAFIKIGNLNEALRDVNSAVEMSKLLKTEEKEIISSLHQTLENSYLRLSLNTTLDEISCSELTDL